jgi:uncharacterized protein (DUF1015 family)
MVVVRPFKGLRPRLDLVEKIASPPYDVLDSDEARVIVMKNPQSFLRVIKPEVDLDPDIDQYSEDVYQQGACNLRRLINEGAMVQDQKPTYYFYRQIMDGHSQVGLVATVSAEDYENYRIRKHEFTRPDKEADRVKHIMTQQAQCGPVFLTYPDIPELNELQETYCSDKGPDADFTAGDGIRHTVWAVVDDSIIEKIQNVFLKVSRLYVADGHHRSAAGTIVAKRMRAENPNHTGREEYNYFLAVVFPKSHMKILAYNRAVVDLNSQSVEEFLARVEKDFVISENAEPVPQSLHQYSMYLDGKWYGLTPQPGSYPEDHPVKSLDSSILQEKLLAPLLDIDDPRTSQRIKFVGGMRGTGELERLVDSGKFQVAFSLYPVTLDQLFSVADSGNVMPPKCTWFEPKLRSGLVVHLL